MALALFIGVSAFAQVPRSNHVYIVAEENHSYEHIVGSIYMPYLNSLLAKGGMATQFYANEHGSLENYLIVTSASISRTTMTLWQHSMWTISSVIC